MIANFTGMRSKTVHSESISKILYSTKNYLGDRHLNTVIDRRTYPNSGNGDPHGFNHYQNEIRSNNLANIVFDIETKDNDIVPKDDITQKLQQEEDYKNLNRLQFWQKYGL